MPSPLRFHRAGILGVGVVGGALRAYFEEQGVDHLVYDPGLGIGSLAKVNEAEVVFVCVPTPYHLETGFDASILEAAVASLSGSKTIVIKSTVLPGTTERLQALHPHHHFLFNPEFLREQTAVQDFREPDRQIVGFARPWDRQYAQAVLEMLPRAPYEVIIPARAAELIKYAANSFLAIKVIFANEMYDLAQTLGVDYEHVRAGISHDARIGPSHLDVNDLGYRGYGGKCLPKDTMSLLDLASDLGVPLHVLEAAHRVNLALRGEEIREDLARSGSPAERVSAAA